MNERDLYLQRLRQLPSSVRALLEFRRRQGLLRIEPPQRGFSSEELQKLLLDTVMRWNAAVEQKACHQRPLEDPQAICHAAITRARDTSAVAIELARQAAPAHAPRRTTDHSFGAVMSRFPGIAHQAVSIRQRMLLSGKYRDLRPLHHFVLDSLHTEGVSRQEYPFNSASLGYRAFCDWLRRELGRGPT